MALISLLLGIVVGAGALVFAFQNNDVVSLTFLNSHFSTSLAIVTAGAVLAGFVLGLLVSVPSIIRRSFTIMGLEREKRGLHKEVEATRQEKNTVQAQLHAERSAEPVQVVDLRQ